MIAVQIGPVRARADECGRVADADCRDVDFDVLEGGETLADLDIQEALEAGKDRRDLVENRLGELGELRRDPADLRLQDGADLGLDLLLRARKVLPDGRLHRGRDAVDVSGQRFLQRILDRGGDLLLDRLQQQLDEAVERSRDACRDVASIASICVPMVAERFAVRVWTWPASAPVTLLIAVASALLSWAKIRSTIEYRSGRGSAS